MSEIMKIIDERETKKKQKQIQKRTRGDRSYRERVRVKRFSCALELGFLQWICKACLIFKSNLELALSIILKQSELYESKYVAVECRCLKIWDLFLFYLFLNPSFKMTTSFTNIARTTASTSKFIYWERFQIIRSWVFILKIIFNFEWIKN